MKRCKSVFEHRNLCVTMVSPSRDPDRDIGIK
jgi:hypothetical protein